MADSIFLAAAGAREHNGDLSAGTDGVTIAVQPTEQARGPWDPGALHGGAPAALITAAFERLEPGAELLLARLGFEFLRPIPLAPLTLSTRIVRPGRRVQELAGERRTQADGDGSGGELVCRASALRVREIPPDVPSSAHSSQDPDDAAEQARPAEQALAPPQNGRPVRFSLDGSNEASFAASAMEMRWLGDPRA